MARVAHYIRDRTRQPGTPLPAPTSHDLDPEEGQPLPPFQSIVISLKASLALQDSALGLLS